MYPEEAVRAKVREKGKWARSSETQSRERSGREMLEPGQEWC